MKRLLFLFGLVASSIGASAQWTTSGTNIYNTNTGNVGIGTTAPNTWKFELVGNGQVTRNTVATSYTSMRLYNNLNSNVRSLEFDYSGSSYATPILAGGPTGEAGSITTTGAYPLMLGTSNVMRMIINSAGNVGIGTASPISKLDVSLNSASTNYGALQATDLSFVLKNTNTTNNNFNIISFQDAGGWGVAHIGTIVPDHAGHKGKLFFATKGSGSLTQRMIIDETGNVGIGTSTPGAAYKLDVNGAINATSLHVNGAPFTGSSSQWITNGSNIYYNVAGNVGIGSTSPDAKLTVNGTVHAKEVRVDLSIPGPDYVFDKDYPLQSLEDLKAYIDANKHLPEVPSAAEMGKNGINLSEMNMLLLKKVEELTLHVIQLKNEIEVIKENIKR